VLPGVAHLAIDDGPFGADSRPASSSAAIFNAHIIGPGGHLCVDPEGGNLNDGLIEAKKMTSSECHKKYG